MKYKEDDKVKIIYEESGHPFVKGTTVTITDEYPNDDPPHYRAVDEYGQIGWIQDSEIE